MGLLSLNERGRALGQDTLSKNRKIRWGPIVTLRIPGQGTQTTLLSSTVCVTHGAVSCGAIPRMNSRQCWMLRILSTQRSTVFFYGLGIARDDVTVALFCTDPRGMSDEFNGGWRACGLQPSTKLPPGAWALCAGAHSWWLDR